MIRFLILFLFLTYSVFAGSAKQFVSSESDYLSGNAAVVNYPVTMMAWIYLDTLTASQTPIGLYDTMDTNNYIEILVTDYNTKVNAIAVSDAGSSAFIASTNNISTGSWFFVCAVFNGVSQRSIWLNSTEATNTSTVSARTAHDQTCIGRRCSASDKYFDGKIAHATMWNIALTDDQVKALAGGRDPKSIQPENLKAYWPLFESGDSVDYSGNGKTLTNSGTTAAENISPKIYFPGGGK